MLFCLGVPKRGGQARNFTTNVLKILDLETSLEQIFSKNCRRLPLFNYGCPERFYSALFR